MRYEKEIGNILNKIIFIQRIMLAISTGIELFVSISISIIALFEFLLYILNLYKPVKSILENCSIKKGLLDCYIISKKNIFIRTLSKIPLINNIIKPNISCKEILYTFYGRISIISCFIIYNIYNISSIFI